MNNFLKLLTTTALVVFMIVALLFGIGGYQWFKYNNSLNAMAAERGIAIGEDSSASEAEAPEMTLGETQDEVCGRGAISFDFENATYLCPAVETEESSEMTSSSAPAMPEVARPEKPKTDLFQTPVVCQNSFNEESSWLICEPGVILDDTAAWTIPSTVDTWYANVPEGGFTYFSIGEGTIVIDGFTIQLMPAYDLNHLVAIRGRIDDTIVDSDLNETAEIQGFTPGHAIWSIMPPGAYVSMDWFRDQLVVSTTTGGTNCGATGCSRVFVHLFDVDSHTYQLYEVKASDIDTWVLQ